MYAIIISSMLLILIERQDSNATSLRTSETFQLPTNTMRSISTQVGTFATFLSAIVALVANILLQFIIRPTTRNDSSPYSESQRRKSLNSKIHNCPNLDFGARIFRHPDVFCTLCKDPYWRHSLNYYQWFRGP